MNRREMIQAAAAALGVAALPEIGKNPELSIEVVNEINVWEVWNDSGQILLPKRLVRWDGHKSCLGYANSPNDKMAIVVSRSAVCPGQVVRIALSGLVAISPVTGEVAYE